MFTSSTSQTFTPVGVSASSAAPDCLVLMIIILVISLVLVCYRSTGVLHGSYEGTAGINTDASCRVSNGGDDILDS